MAEIYRHTDEDGYRVSVTTGAAGDLMVSAFPVHDFARISAVDVPEVDGRRLLAALQRHYALPETRLPEPASGGVVEPVKLLSYHYGPTSTDPDPGAMWCYACGGRVDTFDGHAVCGCGAQQCESPVDCGDDACQYRAAEPSEETNRG